MKRYNQVLIGLLCAVPLLLLSACTDSRVTRSQYNNVDMGMRYSEVVHILGTPTWCDNFDRPNECRWGTDERHVHVTFVARRVVDKQSRGL
ncbi:hypothetical protein [Aliidiomarina sanyensis]|uniref:DUF3862 domain-containing protein n=1 Tax=Aliidiomarina sanyensis TaxID=1249555 RepID=A0A432WDJ1_9GAMM|nr:hypothetical protein [Aliidiomarina sanyensis]RUO30481.1 hypothetical protein CWE11_08900 [Aliidiomarina sanyensis]